MEWLTTLAIRRRADPLHAQRLIEDLILRERAFDTEAAPEILDPNTVTEAVNDEALPDIERFDEIAETHQDTVQLLHTWKESAPKLLEKVSRLEDVIAAESKLTP
ncbi:hypothetical protein FRC03_002461 [Tulasnella sp. 419]|nr:hypothetical protein FRC03_002461 [Tulasnella sp. 419]